MVANLDFEARVPVPFSVFPSSYKETAEVETTTQTHEELEIQLPPKKAGRVGQYSSTSVSAQLPPRREEEIRITREEEQYRRPGVHRHEYYEEHRPSKRPSPSYSAQTDSYVERPPSTLPALPPSRHSHSHSRPVYQEEVHVSESTLDTPHHHHHHTPTSYHKDTTTVVEETIEVPQHHHHHHHKSPKSTASTTSSKFEMGYYADVKGHHHPYSQKMADKYSHEDAPVRGGASHSGPPNTVSIPCHHIRMGDILILQGRPCQVIRISTSGATGQHRYLGVDLFTKQLHEESSQVQHPGPSVVVQTMFGPVFKQYRVLDMQDGNIVAMTESGDVKPGLPVSEQGNLWGRLTQAFESGRGSVRVLVLTDAGRELAVDMKVIHGSRL
ncbi:hypothetical protein PG990_011316 [Apiospora arundinis]